MKIVVGRPAGQADELVDRLEALGHEVVAEPLIAIEPLGDEPIELGGYDWVIVTSANGARELRRRAVGIRPRVAAIGRATADAMGGADLVPGVSTQEGLLAEFPKSHGRVLFAAAEGARTLLAEALDADVLILYRTVELAPDLPCDADLVVLSSASQARALGRMRTGARAVTIGPETTTAARAAGVDVLAEATTHDSDGLVAAVEAATSTI